MTGDLAGAVAQFREVVAEADAAHDVLWRFTGLFMQAVMLAYHGDASAARAAANAAIEAAAELGGFYPGLGYVALTVATLAAATLPRRTMRSRRAGTTSVSSPRWRQSGPLTWPRPRWRAAI